jgi:hypothetical protein
MEHAKAHSTKALRSLSHTLLAVQGGCFEAWTQAWEGDEVSGNPNHRGKTWGVGRPCANCSRTITRGLICEKGRGCRKAARPARPTLAERHLSAVLTALGFPGEPKAGVEKIAGKTREEWERDTYMQYPDTQALLAAAFRALTAESRLERAEKVLTRAVDLLDCWSYNPKSSFYRACPDKNQQRCPNCLVSMDARSYFTEEKRG